MTLSFGGVGAAISRPPSTDLVLRADDIRPYTKCRLHFVGAAYGRPPTADRSSRATTGRPYGAAISYLKFVTCF